MSADPATLAKRGNALSATLLAHVPADRHDEYRFLRLRKGLTKAEATAALA